MAFTGGVSTARLARHSKCKAKAHLSFAACLFMLLCSSLQAPPLLLQSFVASSILLQLISLQHTSAHFAKWKLMPVPLLCRTFVHCLYCTRS